MKSKISAMEHGTSQYGPYFHVTFEDGKQYKYTKKMDWNASWQPGMEVEFQIVKNKKGYDTIYSPTYKANGRAAKSGNDEVMAMLCSIFEVVKDIQANTPSKLCD